MTLILGKSPMKWLQHPGMTKAVDWYVKHKFEQTGLWNWLAIKAKFHIESPWERATKGCTTKMHIAKDTGERDGNNVIRLRIKRYWVRSSLAASCCVLEQGTLTPQTTGLNMTEKILKEKICKINLLSGMKI